MSDSNPQVLVCVQCPIAFEWVDRRLDAWMTGVQPIDAYSREYGPNASIFIFPNLSLTG